MFKGAILKNQTRENDGMVLNYEIQDNGKKRVYGIMIDNYENKTEEEILILVKSKIKDCHKDLIKEKPGKLDKVKKEKKEKLNFKSIEKINKI